MSVIRVHKNKNFTVMSNVHLRDMDLSLKAKGLLSVMLSLPDNWNYSIAGLCSICKENETAIKSTIKELKEKHYVIVDKKFPNETESKKYEYVYNIFEEPQEENQAIENQGIENLPLDNLHIENHHINKSTDISNTDKSNIEELNTDNKNTLSGERVVSEQKQSKSSNSKSKPVNRKKEANELFERLWELYPVKKGKGSVSDTQKLKLLDIGYDEMERAVSRYVKYVESIDYLHYKNGSTFFNSGYIDYLDANYTESDFDKNTVGANPADTELSYKEKLSIAKRKAKERYGEEYGEDYWDGMEDGEIEAFLGIMGINI